MHPHTATSTSSSIAVIVDPVLLGRDRAELDAGDATVVYILSSASLQYTDLRY